MKRIFFYCIIVCQCNSFAQSPDLGTLKKEGESSSLKYVAIGSVLSAGVRDGGVYEAAQKTSFPALLALQMGINDFRQPVLADNGTGHKNVSIENNGILKFTETKGLDDTRKGAILPKVTSEIDNLAIPYQKVFDIYESDENRINPLLDNRSFRHLQRYAESEEKKVSYFDLLRAKAGKIDFFTFELGFHDYIQFVEAGGYATDITYMNGRESVGEERLLKLLLQNTSKGVILNIPDYLRFPIFKRYTLPKLYTYTNKQVFIEHWQKTHVRGAQEGDIFLPKKSVNNLIRSESEGTSVDNPIKDEDVLDLEEQRFANPGIYNRILKNFAEKYKLPLVDLYALYNRIIDGEYVNEEGITVDISYPGGNFFSADGITPTALGQAIITNEIISVINTHYGANIPALSLRKFL